MSKIFADRYTIFEETDGVKTRILTVNDLAFAFPIGVTKEIAELLEKHYNPKKDQ